MKATVYYTDNGKCKCKHFSLVGVIQHDDENGLWFITYCDIKRGVDTTEVLPDTTEKVMLSYEV